MTASLLPEDDVTRYQPLAARLRPLNLGEFVGQEHLLSPGKSIFEAIQNKLPHSMILWGPPGTGKTTLARILTRQTGLAFDTLSAVTDGVKEVRQVVARARLREAATV